jgi:peptidoglycan-associated lipoprotein
MKKLVILIIALFLVSCASQKKVVDQSAFKTGANGQGAATSTQEGKTTTKWDKNGVAKEGVGEENLTEEQIRERLMQQNELLKEDIAKFENHDIHFDFDDYKIKADDIPYLESLALWLKNHPGFKITIEGHCDERGSDMYNLALGEKRANSVKDFLTTMGVPSSEISCISYGEERPIDSRHNEEAWAKNRRCHFVISK